MMMEIQTKHATRDGREIPPTEMETRHLWAARASLLKWLRDEDDPDQRHDLRANLSSSLTDKVSSSETSGYISPRRRSLRLGGAALDGDAPRCGQSLMI